MKLQGGVGGGGDPPPPVMAIGTRVGEGDEEGGDGELDDTLEGGEGDVIIYEELEDRKGSDNGRREASTTHWNPEYSSNGHRRHPMKGGTSIVYHARFQAEVSAKVKLFGRARGTRFMDRNRRLLSSGQVSARFDLRASLSSAS